MADQFRHIFEYATLGICMIDSTGVVLAANATFCRMVGYSREEVVGLHLSDLNREPRTSWPELEADIPKPGERPQLFQREFRHKDGHSVWVHASSSRLPPGEDGLQKFILQVQDNTDLMNLKLKLEDAQATARENETVKQQFLANVSREIRTPLTPILGFYDIISKELKGTELPQIDRYLQIIRHNCNRLTRTVDEIVHMSELQAGALILNKEILNLSGIVDQIYRQERAGAASKDLDFNLQTDVQDARIFGDRQTLVFAISNLIDNAIKYTHEGSIDIHLTQEHDYYRLEIRDTGVGISEENLEAIMEAFVQESHGETRLYGGLGLGLTISRNYLDLNEVRMAFQSRKHEGTIVTLRFPARASIEVGTSVEELLEEAASADETRKPLILVVEDDLHAQLLTELHLKDRYETLFATSAEEARKQLGVEPVDLILLDISLEGEENGLELARSLRKQSIYADLPIVALTAHAFASDRRNAMAAGCTDFMTKPIVKKQLLAKVAAALHSV